MLNKKIGWIGLGRMGTPMVQKLLKKGMDVSIWNRTNSKAELLISDGAKVFENPSELSKLLQNPDLVDLTIEEIMRYDGPTNSLVRNVAKEHELHNKILKKGAKVILHPVRNPSAYGVATLNNRNKIIKIIEKPKKFVSNLAVTGLYFFDNNVINLAFFKENFESTCVNDENDFSSTPTSLLLNKFKRVGSNVNVTTNEVNNPNDIIKPKSIIGFISLKINDIKAHMVVSTV